jgi:23S rRNA pseudouridine1911/1915/1917 synthase
MSGEEPAIDVFTLRPERSQIGMRLDRYVASELHDLSRTYLQALIDGGNVQVDGVVRRAAFKVTPGQLVTVTVPESTDVEIQPEDLPLQLLYVDRDVVVLDKPAGLVVHPAPGHASGTLVNALLHHFPDISISGSSRPGLVHRLDKDTSGVMVVARNDRAQQSLVRQWQARTVDKHYLALVSGVVEEDEATIDAPIARDPANRLRMAVRRDGKDAVSHFIVSERLARSTLLDVRIESGRTHQIRVHLAMIGHPVLGDAVYADARARHLASSLQCPRQFLHAASLTFDLPSGDRKTFVSPMPVDLVEVLDRARTEQR